MAVGRTQAVVVALLVALLVADAAVHVSLRSRFRRLHRVEDTQLDAFSSMNDDVTEGTFTQKLCHFNPQVTDTWAQRFWQNDQFFKDGGPQFLNIGGEGPESGKRISHPSLPIVQWASQVNARIWNLEHRFYGKSRPTADQSVDNLKFLNSRQALEDLADFIAAKNKELNIQNPRWVVFGGSYPGALTLWFRVVHPELTVGGVGSSAPIEVVTDFFDYLRVCEDSFRTFSPQCAENIRAGFESLREHLDSVDQRAELDQAFNFQPPLASMELDWKNLQNVYKTVLDPFMGTVQYARPYTETNGSIADVCAIMAQNASSPIDRLAKVHSYRQEASGQPLVTPVSYENDVANLRNESFESTYASDRSWTWQTCNEFGYFQTTGYNGIFGTLAPVDFDINLCADVFGAEFTIDEIRSRVQATRDHYGRARDYNGTNVVIPNGSLDPWHALGTYKPKDPSAVSVLIDGTAHCADREPANDTTDPQSLKDARTTIWTNIQQWLGASEQPAGQPVEETGLTARRAPEFRTTICFDCDAESGNKNKLRNPMPEHLQRKLGDRFFGGRHLTGGFLRQDLREKFADQPRSNVANSGWITQKLDHFNKADNRIFQQLIYKNDEYFDKSAKNPVVFLFISGEAPGSDYWITWESLPIISWANRFGARLYLLEHRFYGKSLPFDSMSVENLQYLTSEQARSKHALGDLAVFINNTNEANNWTSARWITYGGSYAGALTAWMRALYPDLTFAAVGSSGPVEATVDFYGYMQTVESSLRAFNNSCGDNLKKALNTVYTLMTTVDGRQQLDYELYVDPPFGDAEWIDQYEVMEFYYSLLLELSYASQNSDPVSNIIPICTTLMDPKLSDLEKLKRVHGGPVVTHEMNSMIDSLKYDDWQRAWSWQTCNEFGFYPSTDIGGDNAYGSVVPVNYFLRICPSSYDPSLTRDELERRIDATNQRYGGARGYKATKSIQVYGTLDPWHTLGFYGPDNSHGEDVITILINGTAHCADMSASKSTDVPDLVQARKTIIDYLTKWLA